MKTSCMDSRFRGNDKVISIYTSKFCGVGFVLTLIILALNLFITAGVSANWNKSSGKSSINKQKVSYQHREPAGPKSDSLPEGVTQDWLNSLRDESGRAISQDPEVDAMQRTIFDGFNAGDRFGNSVSSAGDVNGDGYDDVIVGAPNYSSNTGRAYIYFGDTIMNTTPDVILTGEALNNNFGFQVSTAGDVNDDGYDDVIVGADGYSSNTGRAYVYLGGAVMNNAADVTMTGEAANNFFGTSVSSAGDVNGDGYDDVIVGADGYSSNTGRTYVYLGSAVMNNSADVIMTGEEGRFGTSVSQSGDVNNDGFSDLIVGAPGYSANTGKVYVFLGGAVMDNAADVTITGEAASNFFGRSVSSAGDVNSDGYSDVITGARGYSSNTGKAYIYLGGAVMDNAADVTMTGEAASNFFGRSVSSAGDVNGDGYSDVIAGADGYSSDAGGVFVYFGGASMNNVADIVMTGEGGNFGFSVSYAGDVNGDGYSEVIVGAFGYSSNTGRAYIFDYVMRNEIIADVTLTGEQTSHHFGFSVSSAGDVNGDGYSDVIVGAYGLYGDTGRAYIYFGGEVVNNVADVIMKGTASNDKFGYSVSSAGDVNGDGYSDLIVGADGDFQLAIPDKVYVYFGGAVMNNVADVIITDQYPSSPGVSVSSAGDVNGDGYSDVIVGIFTLVTGNAYIYFGGESMDNSADLIMTGAANNDQFGFSVSEAGDVNSDGYSDVIVGAPADIFTADIGKAYIFFGGSVMNNSADVTMSGEAAGHHFGASVSSAGDVNGDGYSDVIVGADRYSTNIGKAYVYFGGSVMNNSPDVIISSTDLGVNYFGISVSSAGDMNGDGYSDVIAGANRYSSFTGRAYVFFGGAVMNNAADIIMTGEAAGNQFGYSVSSAGDMNGDGYSDVIAGATFYSPAGRAYIYLASAISIKPTLNLTMFIQGFYNSFADSQVKDTITVELRNSTSPFAVADQSSTIVSANGTVQLRFLNAPDGNYYIAVKHRNSIETWSANAIVFSQSTPVNYDISAALSQSYGNNEVQVDNSPLRFAIYSGDENQDGTIDVTDVVNVYNDGLNGVTGYVSTDMNGDDFVDVSDLIITYNNSINVISVITP